VILKQLSVLFLALWSTVGLQPTDGMQALPDRMPVVAPESVGISGDRLKQIDGIISGAIDAGMMPGCVVCVGRQGKIVKLTAWGDRQVLPDRVPMTTDTVFDLASLTKPVATATSVMMLVERGKLGLDDRVAGYFPEFSVNGKDRLTVRDLLLHRSGLIPDNPLADYAEGAEVAWQKICGLELQGPVGERFRYSDVNFIVLGKLVEHLAGKPFDVFVRDEVFVPLGMNETGFLPGEALRQRAAVTDKRDGAWIQGEVHDPRALALGGVAGHAGLFSTAEDLTLYAQAMVEAAGSKRQSDARAEFLSPATVGLMTTGVRIGGDTRGLGWDKRTGYSSNRGDLLSESAFGHGGYTGTVLWIDPERELFVILLSNRLHPNGPAHNINPLAGRVMNVVASSILDGRARPATPVSSVLTGIDVLQRDGFRILEGQRVGLITNQTGRNAAGTGTAELMHESPAVKLTALFSPEHGFGGTLDQANIANAKDETTGLEIFSLYGEARRPTAEMLENVDTLVFDIQDIGTRFYTYVSTMGEAMRAAAEHGKKFVVLDRPNPIGGIEVAGPMLDAGAESFVGYFRLPVRHGMTVGELAMMMRDGFQLDLDLEIVRCEGWTRDQMWDQTGLEWVNPSPNMRSLAAAVLYPGVGLFEMTNVSVGRGTDTPFKILGAPWMDGRDLSRRLNAQDIAGVVFVPVSFTPASSKFGNQSCSGVNMIVVDRKTFDPVSMALCIAVELRRLHPVDWETGPFNRLMGNERVFQLLQTGGDRAQLMEASRMGVEDFRRRRAGFLLYE